MVLISYLKAASSGNKLNTVFLDFQERPYCDALTVAEIINSSKN